MNRFINVTPITKPDITAVNFIEQTRFEFVFNFLVAFRLSGKMTKFLKFNRRKMNVKARVTDGIEMTIYGGRNSYT